MGFLLFALSTVVLLHLYLWLRLVRGTTVPGRARRFATVGLVTLALLLVLALVAPRALPHPVAEVVVWPGYLWLAVMFYLFVVLLVLEVPTLVARWWLRRSARTSRAARMAVADREAVLVPGPADTGPGSDTGDGPGPTPAETADSRETTPNSRRLFLARGVAITAGLVAVGATTSGVRSALGPPVLRRVQIPLAKLPRSADGLRIALVSDIYLGPITGRAHAQRVVDMINGLGADVVAVVGDLVDGSVEELGDAAAPLRGLRGRLGSYFVTGNHEYFSGYQEWIDEVTRLGLQPLRNERVELPRGLDLAGVNDVTGRAYADGPDFERALGGRDPGKPVVLLAHQPVQATEAARNGVDLQLSGHTHGGQLWPFNYLVKLQQPVVTGLGEVDGMPVYVTNGAGFWGPPVRVGASPDISLIELRSTS